MSSTLKISNGDIEIDAVTGMAAKVSGIEKCSQDMANVLMTERNQPAQKRTTSTLPRAYGSELATLNVPVFFSGLGEPLVSRKIQEAVQSLMAMQASDPNVTDDERISDIVRLVVQAIGYDDFLYFVQVRVASGQTSPPAHNLEAAKLDHQFPVTSGVVTDGPENAIGTPINGRLG